MKTQKILQLVSWLSQNKKKIARLLYLTGALVENMPDLGHAGSELKRIDARIITSRTRSRGKRPAHK